MTEPRDERERHIQALMERTGKTHEQIDAFLTMLGSAMGWKRVSDDEFRDAFRTFATDPKEPA